MASVTTAAGSSAAITARTMATPATPVVARAGTSSTWTSPIATMGTELACTKAGYPSTPSGGRPESFVGVGRKGPAPR